MGRFISKFGEGNEENQAGAGIATECGWRGNLEAEELAARQNSSSPSCKRLGVETDFFQLARAAP